MWVYWIFNIIIILTKKVKSDILKQSDGLINKTKKIFYTIFSLFRKNHIILCQLKTN